MKSKTIFVCTECDYQSVKWLGRCPSCQSWNTMEEQIVEEPVKKSSRASLSPNVGLSESRAIPYGSVGMPEYIRTKTGIGELDRVLGGGVVSGSVVLLAGEPGIGKSTLLMQLSGAVSNEENRRVLYVSGEESQGQLKLRAERLGIDGNGLYMLTDPDVDVILREIDEIKPSIIIADSVQTLSDSRLQSSAGSVTQIRESTARLIAKAKADGISMLLVGHINKEGSIAGPKVLEHMVDAVLYFEGERTNSYRIIRAIKNRFGSTNEIGVFEMGEKGLAEIPNPSEVVMAERPKNTSGSCAGCVMQGTRPIITEIQSLVTKTVFATGKRAADGFDINRLGLLIAVLEKRMGLKFYENDVYLNVAGGLTLDEPSADLSIAMSLISGITDRVIPDELIAFGEIGLSGEVRAVSHIDYRVKEAVRLGFKEIVLPEKNINQSLSVPSDVKLIGVTNIYQALACMRLKKVSE